MLLLTGGCRPNPAFRCLITYRKLRNADSSALVRVYGCAAPTAAAPSLPPLTCPQAWSALHPPSALTMRPAASSSRPIGRRTT